MMNTNIMIVGVGGQGTLLTSRILGNIFTELGLDVKVSEVHGMSQRGGSVVTYVRCAEKVHSPVINEGEADFILAFERLEAARWLSYLKEGGRFIINDQRISPMPVITGAMEYPENIIEKLKATGADIKALDALSLAEKAGSAKAVNLVLLGVLSMLMSLPEALWTKAIETAVKPQFLAMNKAAFDLGRGAV